MKKYDEFNAFAEILGNLIAKYADVLDFDSIQEQNFNSENTKNNENNIKNNDESIAS